MPNATWNHDWSKIEFFVMQTKVFFSLMHVWLYVYWLSFIFSCDDYAIFWFETTEGRCIYKAQTIKVTSRQHTIVPPIWKSQWPLQMFWTQTLIQWSVFFDTLYGQTDVFYANIHSVECFLWHLRVLFRQDTSSWNFWHTQFWGQIQYIGSNSISNRLCQVTHGVPNQMPL